MQWGAALSWSLEDCGPLLNRKKKIGHTRCTEHMNSVGAAQHVWKWRVLGAETQSAWKNKGRYIKQWSGAQ